MELHDHLSQLMTGLLLQLDAARNADRREPGGGVTLPFIERASQLARQGIEETRRTIRGLRVAGVDGDGLGDLLLRAVRPLAEGTGIEIRYDQQGLPYPLPRRTVHELFRVGQEAVTNAIRHGGARRIDITLHHDALGVRLVVADDGRGFDPGAAGGGPGMGLSGMERRVNGLGGDIAVTSSPGQGTRLEAFVPRQEQGR
jgi:signal transduction histidine kinase